MPIGLLKYGIRRHYPADPLYRKPDSLKSSYDVVIIGAGGHGLAAAYYLAKDHGITRIAVLDKGYLAGGNTARNTAIIRSNYLTPEASGFTTSRCACLRTSATNSTSTSFTRSAAT